MNARLLFLNHIIAGITLNRAAQEVGHLNIMGLFSAIFFMFAPVALLTSKQAHNLFLKYH
jgi:hypothetical protein